MATDNENRQLELPTDSQGLTQLIRFLQGKLDEAKAAERERWQQQHCEPEPESEQAFSERQNCPRVFHQPHRVFVYANGAVWTGRRGMEPPQDRAELLATQILYWEAMLERAEKQFEDCGAYINRQAEFHALGAGPLPAEQAYADLEKYKQAILECRAKLSELRAELSRLTGPTPLQQAAARIQQEQTEAQAAVMRAAAIQI